jgi:hypothetical protein
VVPRRPELRGPASSKRSRRRGGCATAPAAAAERRNEDQENHKTEWEDEALLLVPRPLRLAVRLLRLGLGLGIPRVVESWLLRVVRLRHALPNHVLHGRPGLDCVAGTALRREPIPRSGSSRCSGWLHAKPRSSSTFTGSCPGPQRAVPAHHGEVGEVDWLAVEIRPAAAVATDLQSSVNPALTCGRAVSGPSASVHSP